MKIKTGKITFQLLVQKKKDKSQIPVVFLHGFGGSAADWNFITKKLNEKFFTIAVDLIGHGKTSAPANPKYYSARAITRQLNNIFNQLKLNKVILIGYSLGGRVALSYAVNYPHKISALVLESTSPGIHNPVERIQRLTADKTLSSKIKKSNLGDFFENWYNQQIFDSLKKNSVVDLKKLLRRKLKNSPVGLKNILSEFSPGKIPDYWNEFYHFTFPVLLINGSLDKKYNIINKKAVKLLKHGSHKIIKGAGHNTHLEKPADFINLVNRFLEKICSK